MARARREGPRVTERLDRATPTIVRSEFVALLADVKGRIQSAQTRAVQAVNAELVRLYWDIGRIIDDRQKRDGWGAAVIPRLALELRNELPDLKGFSERNIDRMIGFYRAYPVPAEFSPPPVAKLTSPGTTQPTVAQLTAATFWAVPWAHHLVLMEKVEDLPTRRWYMERTLSNGWSRNVLALQIETRAHARHGRAVSNFAASLPAPQSDLAQQALKDPYIFDFRPSPSLSRNASSKPHSFATWRSFRSNSAKGSPLSAGSSASMSETMTFISICFSIICDCGRSSSST